MTQAVVKVLVLGSKFPSLSANQNEDQNIKLNKNKNTLASVESLANV